MKKDKQPSPAKAARKGIQDTLAKAIKAIAAQLQKQGIHTEVDIEKESKKLAKKITKGAKVDAPAAPAEIKESKPAAEVKAPAKQAAPSAAKPTAKPAAPKAGTAAAPKAEKAVIPAATIEPAASAPVVKATKASAKKPAAKK